jgi:hypothetical protein
MWSLCQSSSNGDRGAGELLRTLLCAARILALSLCVGLLAGGSNRAHSSQMGVTQGVATAANESVVDVLKLNHRNPDASPVGIGGCAPAPTVPITWSSRINVSNNAGFSSSPALAIDTAGTLHAAWYDNSVSGNLDVLYASKEPDQQSWSAPIIISNTPGSSYWPAIAIDATDNVHVAWEDGGTGGDILYATKPAGSADWTEPVHLSNSPGTAHFVALTTDGAGNVHAVWNDDTPGNAEIYYAMRPQGVITWTTPAIVAGTPGTSWAPTIAADITGTLHVAWHDFTPGVTEIYYATKPGPAGPWSSPIDVSRTTGTSYFPALAVDSSGTVHLVWQDTIVTGATVPFEILYAQKRPGEGWTAYVNLSRGSGSAEMPALAVGPEDALHVAWDTTTDPRLLYVRRPAPEMGWTAPVTVTAVSPGIQYPAPALAAALFDAVHLLWSDVGPLGRDIFHSTAAPPPIPEDHVLVLDEEGFAVAGACIYQNGIPTIATDDAGISVPPALTVGDILAALQFVIQQPTIREGHATPDSDGVNWAYRTCLTDVTITPKGVRKTHVVTQTGQQRLIIKKSNPLVLFNLVVSIEWDATITYTDQISRAAQYASNYLYDVTDGQMAFGQVTIYDSGEHWADADVQISTKNIVRPHAYVGGITSEDTSHVIRLGRGWDGHSGNQGHWDQPDGFHTLGHEFGHYALHLYDEYFAYLFDHNDNLVGEVPAYCTGPENRDPASAATNASVMDYQYTTSELSARGVPGLWSPLCEQTAQWQLTERQLGHGESPWETLARMYTDTLSPPRWRLTTPLDRGNVMTGPVGLPGSVLPLPTVTISNTGASGPPCQLIVYDPEGELYWGAIVALYKQSGRVVGQGFTAGDGRLDIYGAEEGDIVRAASMDGGLAGSATVGVETCPLSLTLRPVQGLAARVVGGIPHMRVVAEPSQDPSQVDLLVFLQGFGPGADLSVVVTEPGSEVGYVPTLSYSPGTDTYEGQISFSATEQGTGRIRAVGAAGGGLVRLQSTYRLQRVLSDRSHDVYSDDGNLSLHLEPGSLLGDEAYFVVMPPGAVSGPLPAGLALVGDPYDVTGSGALVTLEQPAILKLHYDGALVISASATAGLGLHRWDPTSETWQAVPASVNEGQRVMVAPVTVLGTYALLGPDSIVPPPGQKTFLPIILNGTP